MRVAESATAAVVQKRWRRDVVVCATLAILAATVGASYLAAARQASLPFNFYQSEFGPAVMDACGRGFVNPSPDAGSPLARFLDQKSNRFDCTELDANVRRAPLTVLQFSMRYLLVCSAWVWRITGITWRSLDVIGAVFIAATVALVYLVFRLLLPAWLSAGLAIVWLTSPLHLYSLTSLRDYSKAPFFVLSVLIIATVIMVPLSVRRLIGMSALLGAALGVGFGFRTDAALNLIPFAVAVTLLETSGVRRRLAAKAAALAACVLMFWICARPAFKAYEGGHGLWHVSLLGLMDPFNEPLRVSPSVYSFGNAYSDKLIETVVSSYASRVQPDDAEPKFATPAYERFTRQYFLELARAFPADFAIRCWASVMQVLNLPFSLVYRPIAIGITSRPIVRFYELRTWFLTAADGITPLLWCVLVVVLAADRLRYALALAALVTYFTAYPMLQFDWRHVFHLEFVALGIDALAIWALVTSVSEIGRRLMNRGSLRRMLWTAAVLAVLVAGPIVALRRYQAGRVGDLVAGYQHARGVDVAVKTIDLQDRVVRLNMDLSTSATPPRAPVVTEMLAVRVDGRQCGHPDVVGLTVRYLEPDNSSSEAFSHVVRVHSADDSSPSVAFVPAYVFAEGAHARFVGIEVASNRQACISRVRQLKDTERMPLLLETVTPESGNTLPLLYQRLDDDSEILPPYLRSKLRGVLENRRN